MRNRSDDRNPGIYGINATKGFMNALKLSFASRQKYKSTGSRLSRSAKVSHSWTKRSTKEEPHYPISVKTAAFENCKAIFRPLRRK
jgi:hypothetical protein